MTVVPLVRNAVQCGMTSAHVWKGVVACQLDKKGVFLHQFEGAVIFSSSAEQKRIDRLVTMHIS